MSAYNFGGSGRNLTKLYQATWFEAEVIKWTLIFQGVHPTKFERAKNVQRRDFRQLSTLILNLWNASTWRKSTKYFINNNPSPIERKKLLNFGPLTKKVIGTHVDPPKWTFSTDYTSALTGCCPLKFLHALDTGQGLLAHTTNRVGGPPKNF